jgi:hypothetical protein
MRKNLAIYVNDTIPPGQTLMWFGEAWAEVSKNKHMIKSVSTDRCIDEAIRIKWLDYYQVWLNKPDGAAHDPFEMDTYSELSKSEHNYKHYFYTFAMICCDASLI